MFVFVAVLPGDPSLFDVALALFLLIGMPLFVLAVLAIVSGYIRHDAEQYLADLEEEDLEIGELDADDLETDDRRPDYADGEPADDGRSVDREGRSGER